MQDSTVSGPSRDAEASARRAGQNSPSDTPAMPADCSADASRKVRLLSLDDLDGRTAAAKAARTLIADIESDLGGADLLTAAQREVVHRTALSSVMLRDMEATYLSGRGIDVGAYTTLANTQSRMLKLIGLERRARDITPDLPTYLAMRDSARAVDSPQPQPAVRDSADETPTSGHANGTAGHDQ